MPAGCTTALKSVASDPCILPRRTRNKPAALQQAPLPETVPDRERLQPPEALARPRHLAQDPCGDIFLNAIILAAIGMFRI